MHKQDFSKEFSISILLTLLLMLLTLDIQRWCSEWGESAMRNITVLEPIAYW